MPDLIYVLIKGSHMLELLMSIGNSIKATFTWKINTKWPISVRDPAIAAVNGYIITFGGSRLQEGSESSAAYNYPNTMIVYVVGDGNSTRVEAPILGRSTAFAAGIGNKFYVIGGAFSGGNIDPYLQEYNTSTGAWVQRSALHATYMASSLVAHNNYLYGMYYDVSAKLGRLFRWDPANPTNSWVSMAPLPGSEYNAGKLISIDGYIYYFGGRKAGILATVVFRYNVTANTWTILPEMPVGFDGVSPIVLNSKIFLLSTISNEPTLVYSYTDGGMPELVDTSPGIFKPINRAGIVTWNNKTYIIGGTSSVAPVGLTNQSVTLELK